MKKGIGFLGALTLLFITLKLTGVIGWHWFWVLSPLILPIIALIVFSIGTLVFFLYTWIFKTKG
jgi:hypothetical protein